MIESQAKLRYYYSQFSKDQFPQPIPNSQI